MMLQQYRLLGKWQKIGDHVDAQTWGATTVAKKERNGGGDGSGGNFYGSGGVKASHKNGGNCCYFVCTMTAVSAIQCKLSLNKLPRFVYNYVQLDVTFLYDGSCTH